ncbi:MAG TPA: glycosyltransferase family 2 protein [Anaerolineales bacterium]|nr:glycosyltransferase family 2 protein [Anaerolineales bacterium]
MTVVFLALLVVFLIPLSYLLLLALASIRASKLQISDEHEPSHRFAIAIPAHDESAVIHKTVEGLLKLDYPAHLFSVHIVADHCSDSTAEAARLAGAIVHERNEGPRTGKGAALSWLFERILTDDSYEAVVIFDADTRVDPQFLRVMDARLVQGAKAIQGQHVISNPGEAWFPALTWAMFLVDNRFQNLGRTNMGWSAKNMGDSICIRADVLREHGWGSGLTEDYNLRQKLLLAGIRIIYEPAAIGYGEAVRTWMEARAQRARWMRGTHDSSSGFRWKLLREAINLKDGALLDGALQAIFPSYSTLSVLGMLILLAVLLVNGFVQPIAPALVWLWLIVAAVIFFYPLFGLFLERAPFKAYLVILTGPLFILWRTWLAFSSRYGKRTVTWVRTAHGGGQ